MSVVGTDIDRACALLKEDQVVAIPTETVYGLAGNALRTEAVARIFEVKNRPTFDPLIVHTDCLEKVLRFVREMPERAQRLAERFWPGPLTLLLPRQDLIPDLVTAGLDTVAVRIPNHPLTRSLLARLDFPLAAPSANPFGYISPTTAQHVQNQLGTQVPYILDGGPCQIGIESTIVGFELGRALVYRLGGISVEDVEKAIGPVEVMTHSTSNPRAPGSLQSHYAPRKPVFIREWESLSNEYPPEAIGLLRFTELLSAVPTRNQVVLSAKGDLSEAAQHLFAGLRSLDTAPVKVIFAELLPEKGLGRAINDRLRRAAAK
ncbi:MAG: threonylcarbamoyl-AMP synthase [Ferruginibacter sp.]|nr:threonylcarbamoyl-AMP synthase [Cytophagales bacterium]